MHRFLLYAAALLLASFESTAGAQPGPLHWVHPGADATHPVVRAGRFDLAFGPDQRPVLVSQASHGVELRRWTGTSWVGLAGLGFVNEFPMDVRAASNWAGDIVVAVRVSEPFGSSIRVFHLRGAQLVQIGTSHPVSEAGGFALGYDARGPVIAWAAGGFITVKRWNGAAWIQLGGSVNPAVNAFRDPKSPALAVTGDGRLIVADTRLTGEASVIDARQWTGTGWVALGNGPPSPAQGPSLGGRDSGAPVVASLGAVSQVHLWNGTDWIAAPSPCPPPALGATLAPPVIDVAGNRIRVVCAIAAPALRRRLVASSFAPLSGWSQLGGGTINGAIRLPAPLHLSYVARSAPSGQLWVAWTAAVDDGVGVIVSTLEPGGLTP